MTPGAGTFLGALATLGGAGLFFSAFGRLRLWRTMANTPTSKARSAAMGLVELDGLAHPNDEAEPGPLSGIPSVWWRFTVEEERTKTDSKGNRETYWHELCDERSERLFKLRDNTGEVLLDPRGAEIESPPRLRTTSGGLFASRPLNGPAVGRFAGSFGRRLRYTEWRIEPQRPLYALGHLRPAASGPVLGAREEQHYYLATFTEAEARRKILWGIAGRLTVGAVLFGGGLYLFSSFAPLLGA